MKTPASVTPPPLLFRMNQIVYMGALSLFLVGCDLHADSPDCLTPDGRSKVWAESKAAMQDDGNLQRRMEEITRELNARATAENWSFECRSQFFADITKAPEYAAFEKEKQPYLDEAMRIETFEPDPAKKDLPIEVRFCLDQARLMDLTGKIKEIQNHQLDFQIKQIKTAKHSCNEPAASKP